MAEPGALPVRIGPVAGAVVVWCAWAVAGAAGRLVCLGGGRCAGGRLCPAGCSSYGACRACLGGCRRRGGWACAVCLRGPVCPACPARPSGAMLRRDGLAGTARWLVLALFDHLAMGGHQFLEERLALVAGHGDEGQSA